MKQCRRHKADTAVEAIVQAYTCLKRQARVMLRDSGVDLTLEQVFTLFILEEKSGWSLGEIAELLDRDKTTVTRMIDGLENRNLVIRVQDELDRRKKLTYLTNEGRQKLKQIERFSPLMEKKATAGLSEEEIRSTKAVLDIVAMNLDDE